MPSATLARRFADLLVPGGIEDFVRSRRRQGLPWRLVCRDLYEVTDGEVDFTHETLRNWFPDEPRKKVS